MSNKKIFGIAFIFIGFILALFGFYLIFVRSHIIGEYTPTSKDCKNSYDCACSKKQCLCTYKKWFKENKMVCNKKDLDDKQIN